MRIFEAVILGLIEGLTEFLPISSTAHLVLFSHLLKIPQTDFQKFFVIFIQGGAFLAVLFGYFKFVLKNPKILQKIFISFLTSVALGLIFYRFFKDFLLPNKFLIIFSLIFVGILFLIFEELAKKGKFSLKKEIKEINSFQAFLIGIFQSFALIPGVSRAGAIILGMLILGFKRKEAVLYSFLVGAITLISASFFEIHQFGIENLFLQKSEFYFLIVGTLTAFVSAFLVNQWFLSYLKKNNLEIFGWYRIIFGILFGVLLGGA